MARLAISFTDALSMEDGKSRWEVLLEEDVYISFLAVGAARPEVVWFCELSRNVQSHIMSSLFCDHLQTSMFFTKLARGEKVTSVNIT